MKNISSASSFKNLYRNNCIYVDKTKFIVDLIKLERVFITRPRRFGKSLTLDTIGTLFETGVEPYFKGTYIYDKWTEPTYPVLRLNFLKFDKKSVEAFKNKLNSKITEFAQRIDVKNYIEKAEPEDSIDHLLELLSLEARQIVILIDEYDCQMTANINNENLYKEFQEKIKSFYANIKDHDSIRFLGITGVTRLKDVSIFSVGSNIKDITNYNAYSQMIGFTRDEIKDYYQDYLKLAVAYESHCDVESVTDTQIDAMLDKLAQNYDGYCFDEFYKKKVFCTWSVNNFFQSIVDNHFVYFGEYWYDNGGLPSILANYLQTHKLNAFDYLDKDNLINVPTNDFINPTSLTSINQNVLMCQTGYLTLRSELKVLKPRVYLGIPNGEIHKAITYLLALKVFNNDINVDNEKGENLFEIGSFEDIIALLNTIMNSVPYDNYPIVSEAAVQNSIRLYLAGAGMEAKCEVHEAKGRADLIVETDHRRIVFELKYAQNSDESKTKLKEAVEQIKSRDYGNILPVKSELIRIAAVFNSDPKVRSFSLYEAV
ncbi:MAG: AAA family ATPase [Succinivibrio sp.]|nr:AAA family ATPase [Succinivibrio sp.]